MNDFLLSMSQERTKSERGQASLTPVKQDGLTYFQEQTRQGLMWEREWSLSRDGPDIKREQPDKRHMKKTQEKETKTQRTEKDPKPVKYEAQRTTP